MRKERITNNVDEIYWIPASRDIGAAGAIIIIIIIQETKPRTAAKACKGCAGSELDRCDLRSIHAGSP